MILYALIHPETHEVYCIRRAESLESAEVAQEKKDHEATYRLPFGTLAAITLPLSVWDIGAFVDQINPKIPVVWEVMVRVREHDPSRPEMQIYSHERHLFSTSAAAKRFSKNKKCSMSRLMVEDCQNDPR